MTDYPVSVYLLHLLLIPLLFVSGSLILDGWLGRFRNAHPHCAACGYDLVHTLEKASACPECGVSVEAEDAIVWNKFDRSWKKMLAGIALGLVTVALMLVAFLP